MKRIILILTFLLLLLVQPLGGALTKTQNTQAMEWTKITNTGDSSGIVETGSIDVSGGYSNTLHIDWCLAEAAAHEGTQIIVQIASEAGVDDAWSTLVVFKTTADITPIKADFANQEAAGQTVLGITDPATSNLDHDGKFVFLEDTVTPANCEIAFQIDNSGDAGDTVTVLDGIAAQKETTSDMWTIDGDNASLVDTFAISIPPAASQARVIFNNWYDTDGTGADGYGRVRLTKMTGL